MEPNHSIDLHIVVSRIVHRWPLILGFCLLGAILGFVFSMLHPAQYQAQAILGVNINYGVTEPLTLMVEDRTLHRVTTLVTSDATLSSVIDAIPDDIKQQRSWLTPADLIKAIRFEQRLTEWWLVVIDEDPEVASLVAQIWADVSMAILDEAVQHAWRAIGLLNGRFDIECTPVQDVISNNSEPSWQCELLPIDLNPEALEGELLNELTLSRGVFPNISYELLRASFPPDEPVLWARGTLIFAGTLVGMIVGIIVSIILASTRDRE